MKRKQMKALCLSIFLLGLNLVSAQSYRAELSKIKNDGLYKVLLPASFRAATGHNFDHIRIKDTAANSVPYVIMDASDSEYSKFRSFEILDHENLKDSLSSYVFRNQAKLKNSIYLKITNTNIDKKYNVYGSDNRKEWFGLLAEEKMQLNGATSKTYIEQQINLPLNNYRFLKLEINDRHSLPIQVEAIGIYENQYFPSELSVLDVFTKGLVIENENKTSQIDFRADYSHQVDAISFKIKNRFYQREVDLIVERKREIRKAYEMYEDVQQHFILSSVGSNFIELKNTFLKDFSFKIQNEDNPPLVFEKISFYQKPKYLVSYLKAGQDYHLIIDDKLKKPSYDLSYFVESNISNLQEAQMINFEALQKENLSKDEQGKKKSFWQSESFMWLTIGLGGLLVIYFAVKMLREMNNT